MREELQQLLVSLAIQEVKVVLEAAKVAGRASPVGVEGTDGSVYYFHYIQFFGIYCHQMRPRTSGAYKL